MFRRFIAAVLSVVLSCAWAQSPQPEPESRIKNQINSIRPGTYIEIKLNDGSKERGYLSSVESDGFSIRSGDPKTGVEARTPFDRVRSVKTVMPAHTPALAWIATGIVAGVVVAALVVYLVFRGNE